MKRFRFIHIPKTAGTSVWKTLDAWHCPALLEPFEVRTLFPQRGLITFGQSCLDFKHVRDKSGGLFHIGSPSLADSD